jgi:hypothetical protein
MGCWQGKASREEGPNFNQASCTPIAIPKWVDPGDVKMCKDSANDCERDNPIGIAWLKTFILQPVKEPLKQTLYFGSGWR